MEYGLPDNIVKAIATSAFNSNGNVMDAVSYHFNNIKSSGMIDQLKVSANTDAHKGIFKSKEHESKYKECLAKASAINRGTLSPVTVDKIKPVRSVKPKG